MERIVQSEKYGQIKYVESFWTGKPSLEINGVPLTKLKKRQFEYNDGVALVPVSVKGNLMMGVTLLIGGDSVIVEPKPKWYEFALTLFIFLFVIIWGNITALCDVLPLVGGVVAVGVVGGAIGGAIGGLFSAVFAMLNLFMVRKVKNIWLKLLVFVGFFALNVLCCYLIALAFLSVV